MDGDGIADLVVWGNLTFVRGLGGGVFAPPQQYDRSYTNGCVATDFDGDGRPDILMTDGDEVGFAIVKNRGCQ
jgi:hypothetical protein